MPDFLLELGSEEIPAGYIDPALAAFEGALGKLLASEELSFTDVVTTATPRRMVFFVTGLPERQSERHIEVAGPPLRVAFDAQGKPTKAAEGFARAQGVSVDQLLKRDGGKGGQVFVKKTLPARATSEILAAALPGMIAAIPFPKSMYWRTPSFRFARPLRRILALLGGDVVPFEVNGIQSGRATVGHPFIAPEPIEMPSADLEHLKRVLRDSFVLVDRDERRERIVQGVRTALAAHGSELSEWDLLEEVTDLVEWPEVLEGSFSTDYLLLPEEVVATAMMEHQRYFPVRDASGRLVNRFLTVVNRPAAYCEAIREGNERVLRARLNDARFFWDADVKVPLEAFAARLSTVVYLAGLGTVADKVARMKELAAFAAGASDRADEAVAAVEGAALSKADLLTEMVYEFPALQGVMGRAYALAQGKDNAVALAIEEHYLPRTLSGDLPRTIPGKLVAIADKADTLCGAFVMGLVPTGSQDPYGLRRAAVGIVRIIVEGGIRLGITDLLRTAWQFTLDAAGGSARGDFQTLMTFVRDRLYQYYLDRGMRHDILRACLAPGFDDLVGFTKRLEAVAALSKEPFWPELVTSVERTYNITKGYAGTLDIAADALVEPEEKELFRRYNQYRAAIEGQIHSGHYFAASKHYLDAFGEPLHTFFDKVFVNVEDERVRSNRLALLKSINLLYSSHIADLSQIVQEGGAQSGAQSAP